MSNLQAAVRAATVQLFRDYAASAGIKLQVYPGRPASIFPPTAFVDVIRETITYPGITLRQRTPIVEAIVIHGKWIDDLEAVTQKDAFMDGFIDYVTTRYHEAGPNTLIAVTATEDLPGFVPDWIGGDPTKRSSYFATHILLEGYAEN